MELENITETFDGLIDVSEMSTDPGGLVPVNSEILERIKRKDSDPKFATFVIESGWSKSKRFWGPELFADVASEINSAAVTEPIVGYKGHIKPENDAYEFPPIQLQWVGAKMLSNGSKAKLAVKAYVRPGTEGQGYLEDGLVKTVSWRGKVAQELFEKGVRIKKFVIESIDLSRPRAAGMSARLVGPLTSEMETEGGNSVKPEEIASLSANELRAHNPALVQSIEAEARTPLETRVSEMETAATAVAPIVAEIPSLKKVLGLADDADDVTVVKAAVTYLREQGKSIRDGILNSVLKKKNLDGDERDVKFARQLIVGEITNSDFQPTGNAEDDEKTVTEMVNSLIDKSDDLKEIVSEMEAAPPSPATTEKNRGGGGSDREIKPGYKSSTLRVRSAN